MTIEADDVVIAVRSRLASFSHCHRLSLGRDRPSARRIARWEGQICTVARLGGEEFGLLAIGMEGIALDRFAESVRRENAACDHGETLGNRSVTASIGVAEVQPACDFQ